MKQKQNIRTYQLKHGIHKEQLKMLKDVLMEYRTSAKEISDLIWQEFFTSGHINTYKSFNTKKSKLSIRYQQTCYAQVSGMIKSFVSNRKNDFNDMVYRSSLSKDLKHKMNIINKFALWFKQDDQEIIIRNNTIIILKDEIKLARKIFKHILNKYKKPTYNNINLALDSKVCELELSQTANHWDYWLKVSSLTPYKKIKIPLRKNQYYSLAKGEFKKFTQLNFKDGKLEILLTKDSGQLDYSPKNDSIGIDFGLRNLISTSKGDLIGRNFINRLREYDNKIIALKLSDPQYFYKTDSYKKIIKATRNYIKNEIGRCLNWVIKHYSPKEIVVEKLEFREMDLSKQLNRLLSNCGLKSFYDKLQSLSNDYGIIITKVNPAYTSKTCSKCGYISSKNRKTQSHFKCECCGNKLNADINGARNIENRRSVPSIKIFSAKKAVLNTLVINFITGIERYRVTDSNTVLYSCPWNLSVISDNPYFKDYLDNGEFNQGVNILNEILIKYHHYESYVK